MLQLPSPLRRKGRSIEANQFTHQMPNLVYQNKKLVSVHPSNFCSPTPLKGREQ